jgi:hypothetical protein
VLHCIHDIITIRFDLPLAQVLDVMFPNLLWTYVRHADDPSLNKEGNGKNHRFSEFQGESVLLISTIEEKKKQK